ncbi:hypothetical protein D3C72_1866770 [compost metagenome]
MADIRTPASAAHECGDFRLRHLRPVRYLVLRRATHLPGAPVFRQTGRLHLLGLASRDPVRRRYPAYGHDTRQGIRGTGMAYRHPHRRRLDRLRHRVLRHADQAQGQAHLRGQLVLRRLHPGRDDFARGQWRRHASLVHQVVFRLCGRAGRHDPVVVRP